ncbi:MAG: Antitoxin component YwqK of the YwqJK toxin-antitoxin module [Ferruginibacter sp.]|nr:Antitoxin component YwqK of the YwqJK toxin-antitoxin module [Ferruginibacter sp.]
MRRVLLFLIFVAARCNIYCQTNEAANVNALPVSINEVMNQLSDDTVMLYYNERWQLVKPACALMFRVSKIDTMLMTFTGQFVDYFMDSSIAVEGSYAKGKKEGLFKLYFDNGQLAQTGNYSNDKKSGLWQYYYESGAKQQVFNFTNNEILIEEFWTEDGKKMVDSGKGDWFGYAAADKFRKISGKVVNGKKDGTWTNTIASQKFITNIENYREGILTSGKMISKFNRDEAYKDTSYCNIEQIPGFLNAEQFQINRCFNNVTKRNYEQAQYPGGIERFYKELRQKYDYITRSGLNLPTPAVYGYITVLITINEKGQMTNFKPQSGIGEEVHLIDAMKMMNVSAAGWKPAKLDGKPTSETKIISVELRLQ